ncbi:MAG: ABC transporter substrate-binding protein [Actinobacteria bacterium]|jgi:ABC-type transport system substrate-binding protein|nr:ABC transporter substrate-binding protein [Actinomycetota bacterium]MCL5444444.1 ABC transporter substrate-binding protein [Actinomycetota bacterium]
MSHPINRRSFLGKSAAVALGAVAASNAGGLLSACGSSGAPGGGVGGNGISSARPKRGGTLTFGVDAEEQGFDPTQARFDEVGVMYARTVFDPLTIVTANGGWAPYLAESVTPNPEYSSWTVTLRPNLMFHDGTPCDGAALTTNFEAHLHSLLTGPVLQPVVESIVQTGPLSVQVNMKQVFVPFPLYLAGGIGGQIAYPVAPSMLAAKNGTDHPVGTGPFVFKDWVPYSHFTATANRNYWRPGYPYLDTITYKPILDSTARSEALQTGSIDMMVTDTPQTIVLYRGNHEWSYIDDSGPVVGEPDMNFLMLNVSKPPFNDPNVRLAVAHAINPDQYSKVIDIGVDSPSTGLFVPGTPYYSKTNMPVPSPSLAREMISQVEQRTGKPVSFTLMTPTGPANLRSATYIQQNLEAVGCRVSMSVMEQAQLINNALDGTYQMTQWRQFSAVDPDLNYIFWSTTTVNDNGLSINMARNSDPLIEAALQEGRTNIDPSVRARAYQSVNERLALDLPYLWTDRAVWAIVADPSVENFNNPLTPTGQRAYGMIGGSIWPTQIWRS